MILNNHLPPSVGFEADKENFFVLVVDGKDIDTYQSLEDAKSASEPYKRQLVKIYEFVPNLVFSQFMPDGVVVGLVWWIL